MGRRPLGALMACLALVAGAYSRTAPEQVHISLGGRDPSTGRSTAMRVAWYTEDAAASVARFGCVVVCLLDARARVATADAEPASRFSSTRFVRSF